MTRCLGSVLTFTAIGLILASLLLCVTKIEVVDDKALWLQGSSQHKTTRGSTLLPKVSWNKTRHLKSKRLDPSRSELARMKLSDDHVTHVQWVEQSNLRLIC